MGAGRVEDIVMGIRGDSADATSMFNQFLKLMHRFEKETVRIAQRTSRVLSMMFKTPTTRSVMFQQSMAGLNTRFTAIQKSLKPLGAEVRKSFEPFMVQGRTAEQAMGSMLNKQKETEKFSKKFAQGYRDMGFVVDDLGDKRLKGLSKRYDSLGGAMRMPFEQWQRFNKTGKTFDTIGGRAGNRIRKMTHGLRGFRMELLGVMFFGMGVQKFFLGLVRPSMELVGVFKIFSVALQILFLPIALKVLDWALKFLGWVSRMGPKLKKWINIFVGIGIVVGSLLFLLGMFGLGIGSVLLAFGALLAPIVMVIAAVLSFIGSLAAASGKIGAIAIALLIFLGIIPAVKGASDTIEEHGGFWEWLSNLIGRAVGWIIGKLDTLWEKFLEVDFVKTALEGLGINVEKLKDPIATLGEALTGVWQGYLEKHPELIEKLGDMGLVADEILEPWNNLETVIPTILSSIVKTIKEKLKEIWDDFTENNPLIEDMGENMDSLKDSMEKVAALAPNLSTVLSTLVWILEKGAAAAELFAEGLEGMRKAYLPTEEERGPQFTLKDVIKGGLAKYVEGVRDLFGARQLGGAIPHTGPYRLHAGETVMPAGAMTINFAPNITVSATSNVDIDMLKSQLSEELLTEVENMNRR